MLGVSKYREGWECYDKFPQDKRVKYIDLTNLPLTIPDNYADEILLESVLEHLSVNQVDFMNEIYRILKPKGIVTIKLPTFSPRCEHERFYHGNDYFRGYVGYYQPGFKVLSVTPQRHNSLKEFVVKIKSILNDLRWKAYWYKLQK